MKNILSPSILSADFGRLAEEIKTVTEHGAEYIHIDVMDGIFVPSISYGMPVIRSIRKETDKIFDVHLMITEPIRYIKEFVEAGADLITVHVEACQDVAATLEAIRSYGIKAALTLNPATPVEEVFPYIKLCDMILVMSVNPGFGGQKFIPETLEKVRRLRDFCNREKPELDIEIDGGVNLSNLPEILEAGANVIVAGSSIYKGDVAENTREFLRLMESERV